MNIPVDNSNNLQSISNPLQTSPLNIEIEEDDQDERDDEQQIEIIQQDEDDRADHVAQQSQRYHSSNEYPEENEQLEVFVGFYRPGEYERENVEEEDDDDDDADGDRSQRLESQKKEEQVRHAFGRPNAKSKLMILVHARIDQ